MDADLLGDLLDRQPGGGLGDQLQGGEPACEGPRTGCDAWPVGVGCRHGVTVLTYRPTGGRAVHGL